MGIDVHNRRLGLTIVLGTMVLTAFFLAQGATRLLARTLLPLDQATEDRRAGLAKRTNLSHQASDPKAILARNIFDSETGPLWPPKPGSGSGAVGGVGSAGELGDDEDSSEFDEEVFDPNAVPPRCEGSMRLVGAVAAVHRVDWSFAAIDIGQGSPLLYREGQTIDEDKQVVSIFPKAVYLRPSDGRLCSLLMFAPADDAPKAPRAPKAPPTEKTAAKSKGDLDSDELDKGIRKISDTNYSVDRALVDKVLANQAALMRSARVIPHEQDGKVVGVKLYGIRRDSLLGKLGVQNGDVLRTINGYDMTSPDSALEAYARLRNADRLTLAVQRRGKSTNIEYQIQ